MTEKKGTISAREGALQVLQGTLYGGGYSNILLKQLLGSGGMEQRERALCTELVYGVLQHLSMLDFYIEHYCKTPLKKLDPTVKLLLELGVYQIVYLEKVPDTAACNESVKLCKKLCRKNPALPGVVNGVLRNVSRNKEHLPVLNEKTKEEYLARRYSLPLWLVELWRDQYGMDVAKALCAQCDERRDTVLRVNSLRATPQQVAEEITQKGGQAEEISGLPGALRIQYTGDISALEGYRQGHFTVQDVGSQLAISVLDPQPGQRAIDMCSAPGGKSVLMGQYMKNQGEILAFDLHPHKVEIIEKNAARMGLTILKAQAADMTIRRPELVGTAQKVLCDVPCSGLGIIAKKPDIRFKAQEDALTLPAIQLQLLKNALDYAAPGGQVVYSTCTLNQEENEKVVQQAIQEHGHCRLEPFAHPYGDIKSEGMLTLLPHIYHSDGFFICNIRRTD